MDKLFKIKDYELLSQKVYRILKERVIKGNLTPGEKILEVNIANQLGVSRTPVREALQKLAADGFVKVNPNLGMMVVGFSLEDTQEVLQIRRVLEGLVASLAAKKINHEEIKKLEKIIEQMRISSMKNDIPAYTEYNGKFHNFILNICGNKNLIKICSNLSGRDHRFKIRALTISGRLKYSLEEHKNILEALKKGDSKKAERLSREHIDRVLENIILHEDKEEGRNRDA